MTQQYNKNVKQPLYERKKRLFSDVEDMSDEEILMDDHVNNSDNEYESKKNKGNKNLKLISNTNSNFHTLRQMRQMKKFHDKENIMLSQDQLDFAKKVVQQKFENTGIGSNINSKINLDNNFNKICNNSDNNFSNVGVGVKNKIKETNNIENNKDNLNNFNTFRNLTVSSNNYFTISENKKNENQFTSSQHEKITEELLSLIGFLSNCEYKVTQNDNQLLSLQVTIEKNENEKMKFILNFIKTREDKDFVEYLPKTVTFKLVGEDLAFNDELEIHKEDLGKMMKRLLVYKFSK